MRRKRTIEDFERVARYYKALHGPMTKLYIETSHLVGKTAPETRMVKKGLELISKARSDLEDRMFEELPHQARIDIFYGQRDKNVSTHNLNLSEQKDREEDNKQFIKIAHNLGERRT